MFWFGLVCFRHAKAGFGAPKLPKTRYAGLCTVEKDHAYFVRPILADFTMFPLPLSNENVTKGGLCRVCRVCRVVGGQS